ncbi:hypothetical protein ACT4XR_19970 (plasmid) [Acinetobacter baumannii]|uniref:hypothetical protein n=1 Tax=Acinetobacter baumannii TaxID=470 RepID=UPI00389176B4
MKILSFDASDRGGLTVLLFHCFFNGSESITHFTHDINLELYEGLPNLYSVCIADSSTSNKKVTAAVFIKTNLHHEDPDFSTTLVNVLSINPDLHSHLNEKTKFLAARIKMDGPPLSEREYLKISVTQYMKHNVDGRA